MSIHSSGPATITPSHGEPTSVYANLLATDDTFSDFVGQLRGQPGSRTWPELFGQVLELRLADLVATVRVVAAVDGIAEVFSEPV